MSEEKKAAKLTNTELEKVSGGFCRDGSDCYLLSGDCFVNPVTKNRYKVLEAYNTVERGTHIDACCLERPSIDYVLLEDLLCCEYVGNNVF